MIFTPEEVKSLNEYQKAGYFHPFTCGGNRTDEHHLDGEGLLVATESGWNPKSGAVMYNIGNPESGQEQ